MSVAEGNKTYNKIAHCTYTFDDGIHKFFDGICTLMFLAKTSPARVCVWCNIIAKHVLLAVIATFEPRRQLPEQTEKITDYTSDYTPFFFSPWARSTPACIGSTSSLSCHVRVWAT